ncbi:MAG: SpaA isopeptide-forming pilin-related protein [Clostridia bacterium]
MINIIKKILIILLLSIIFISYVSNIVKAVYEIKEASIVKIEEAPYHLKYYNESKKMYSYSVCSIVGYYKENKFYPAYCLNRDLHGVGYVNSYTVDIDNVIENNQVWRAVKNGYPYKTASEMGLESDYDAFAVTKFAVYCLLGQADINLYTADENDAEGQAMLRALRNLVDIGRNQTDTFYDELKISKVTDLIEDGNYYSITYKVNAGNTISKYKIKSVSGLTNGELLTDVNGNIKTEFNSNEKFKIKIPKSNLSSDKNIDIEIESNLKNYPMFYGKTRISGTQDYLLTANSYQNLTANINTKLNLNTGKIIINKKDDETKQGIPDTTFEICNSQKQNIGIYTTDKSGKIEIPNLYQDLYYAKEIKSNENYILNQDNEYSINVEYNKTSTIDIENEHKKGNLEILKVDKENNNITLGNVGFELYNDENGSLVGTYYTDENGKIEIKDLRIGNYKLKEISTNEWYNLAENQNLQIKWNETTKTQVEDELKKGQIKVIKVDKENNEIKIPNVVFEVQDSYGNLLEKIKTNQNGEAITSKYPLRDYPNLRLHEVETDEKYALENEIKEITLEENQIKEVKIENEKIKGYIQIVKTSKDDNKMNGTKKGEPLEGVKFEIYDTNGNTIQTLVTDSNGIAKSKKLEKGIYKVKEVETNEWYLLDQNIYEAEIKENKKTIILNIENVPANPDGEIKKKGPDEVFADDEIQYNISLKNSGNVALDNFVWEDEIPTDFIRVTKIKLGTYNQDNSYNLYYKTNFSEDYILMLEDINTKTTEEIDFSKELSDNEFITNIKLDFGSVDIGFKSEEDTLIFAKVNSNVKSGDVFENKVCLQASFKGYNLSKSSNWKTRVYKVLPLTGM